MMLRIGSGRRKSWPILIYCPDILLEVPRKITNPFSQIVSLHAYSSRDLPNTNYDTKHYTPTFRLARVFLEISMVEVSSP
jgi:hypothetical protein